MESAPLDHDGLVAQGVASDAATHPDLREPCTQLSLEPWGGPPRGGCSGPTVREYFDSLTIHLANLVPADGSSIELMAFDRLASCHTIIACTGSYAGPLALSFARGLSNNMYYKFSLNADVNSISVGCIIGRDGTHIGLMVCPSYEKAKNLQWFVTHCIADFVLSSDCVSLQPYVLDCMVVGADHRRVIENLRHVAPGDAPSLGEIWETNEIAALEIIASKTPAGSRPRLSFGELFSAATDCGLLHRITDSAATRPRLGSLSNTRPDA